MLSAARALCCLLLLALGARAQSVARAGADASAVYHNPVVAGDFPDPSIIRVGADYWSAVTTGGWAPHFQLLRSRDLVNWRVVGAVFQRRPRWAKDDFWAPEIEQYGGRFYVYYAARRDEGPTRRGTLCVAVATAPRPVGPYTDHGPLVCEIEKVGSIDPQMVRDERGRPFLIWKEDGNDRKDRVQPTRIWAQPLSADGLRLKGTRREILRNTEAWEGPAIEGSFILRRGDWFYHFYSGNACCGHECRYALGVARARRLLGPWEKNPANPILAGNEEWRCPGHGSIVSTPDGREFLMYHSYRERRDTWNIGREAMLDEVRWPATGWPEINGGRGPTSVAPAPLGVGGHVGAAEFFDDFDAPAVGPQWQWPLTNAQSASVSMARGGLLLLTPLASGSGAADAWTGAVLARRTTTGSYVATALVEAPATGQDARTGLAAYSWREWAVGIATGGGRISVWQRRGKQERVLAETAAPAAGRLYLRMTAAQGATYRFAYSTDGRDWRPLGEPVMADYIEGAHVALTAGGPPGSVARFDSVRVTPTDDEGF